MSAHGGDPWLPLPVVGVLPDGSRFRLAAAPGDGTAPVHPTPAAATARDGVAVPGHPAPPETGSIGVSAEVPAADTAIAAAANIANSDPATRSASARPTPDKAALSIRPADLPETGEDDAGILIDVRELPCTDAGELFHRDLEMRSAGGTEPPPYSLEELIRIDEQLRAAGLDTMSYQQLLTRDRKLPGQLGALAGLGNAERRLIAEHRLPWSKMLKYAVLPHELFTALLEALDGGLRRMSSSDIRHHLDLLMDIRGRLGSTPADLLEMQDRELSEAGYLERIRNPERTRIEAALGEIRKSALRHSGIDISLPENLEGDRIQLRFSVRNSGELESKISALNKLSEEVDRIEGLLFEKH